MKYFDMPMMLREVQAGDTLEAILLDKFSPSEIVNVKKLWDKYPIVLEITTDRPRFDMLGCHVNTSSLTNIEKVLINLGELFDSRHTFEEFIRIDNIPDDKEGDDFLRKCYDIYYRYGRQKKLQN